MAAPSRELADLDAVLRAQYALDRDLGRGGMGVVFLARDLRLDRLVAIKALPLHPSPTSVSPAWPKPRHSPPPGFFSEPCST